MTDKPEVSTTQDARSGETKGHMRYVLLASVLLAVAAMLWLAFGTPIASQEGRSTGPSSEQVGGATPDPGTGQAQPAQ